MEIKEIEFENYGRCIRMDNGLIDVVVTIDFGPRIVRLGFRNEGNVFYTDLERKYVVRGDEMTNFYGKNAAFYYYGGHRLWIAPERIPETYYPDNDPVVYGLLPDGVSFSPPRQKKNELQVQMEVILGEGATDIMVVHTAKNLSRETQPISIWPVTQLKPGGITVVPQNRSDGNPQLPNRVLTLWPYSDCRDGRFFAGNRFLTLKQGGAPFKFGVNNVLGWAAYVNRDFTLIQRYVHTPARYPDFGCSCEVYQNEDYAALESLSPRCLVEPGEAIRHVENLALYKTTNSVHPTDEKAIERYFSNMV